MFMTEDIINEFLRSLTQFPSAELLGFSQSMFEDRLVISGGGRGAFREQEGVKCDACQKYNPTCYANIIFYKYWQYL